MWRRSSESSSLSQHLSKGWGGGLRRATLHSHHLSVAAGDDAGVRSRPQNSPGNGAGLHVDPGGRSLLPARLHQSR